MMNNQFNTTNLTAQQHGIQMAQHVATSPPQQASAAVLNNFLNAQAQQQQHQHQQHHHQHQQLAAAVAAGALYADSRQLHINSNPLEKNYYTTSGTLGGLGTPQRYYTTAGPATTNPSVTAATAGTHHPNTILITNNFAHHQPQQLSPEQQRNIRIVTSAANPLSAANMATPAGGYQHAQHVFNLNNNKQLQHLFPQHLIHQQSYQPATTTAELLQQHFAAQQHFPTTHHQQQQPTPTATAAAAAIQMPQFYVTPESTQHQLATNPKIVTNIPANNVTSAGSPPNNSFIGAAGTTVAAGNNPNSSTVVLDRINICINNLYTDTSSSSSASNSLASTPAQQPSPIIPAIQHKAIIENGHPPTSTMPMVVDLYESNALIIDEPDSTTTATTPHTPPTTPENTPPPPSMPNIGNINSSGNNTISTTCTLLNSPSTSSYQHLEKANAAISTTKQNFAAVAQNIEEVAQEDYASIAIKNYTQSLTATTEAATTSSISSPPPPSPAVALHQHTTTHNLPSSNTPLTPPTPPSPEMSTVKECLIDSNIQTPTAPSSPPPPQPPPPLPLFANGEDVFIKRQDDRFYLGTVIDTARNQFLVRFDDKTELWCEAGEMRKLGGSSNNTNKSSSSTEENLVDQPMCVSCKHFEPESKVEICERCGRGYHRKCTTETAPGSDVWLCKRCAKPMKLNESSKLSSAEEETEMETCLQLPYDVDSLTWDDKHRVNEEQIYCYCGKSGRFDHNMLQCCRCSNWYHTHCTQKFKGNLLRGDVFFVFCCSVCNYGDEYLRRLQIDWVDLVHLIIYNLYTMKKHQHQKYHHLLKDINPFVLEKRKSLPIPAEWKSMPENEFLDKIKTTLQESTERFICGKDFKRDHYFFALRTMGPPSINKINIKPHDPLSDNFLLNNLKLKFLAGALENADLKLKTQCFDNLDNTPKSKPKSSEDSSSRDVFEFDDTSEDEIPIKHILEKVKKTKMSPPRLEHAEQDEEMEEPKIPCKKSASLLNLEKMDVEDDNANDLIISPPAELPPQTEPISTHSILHKNEKKLSPKKESKQTSPLKSSLATTITATIFTEKNSPAINEKKSSIKRVEKNSRKRKGFALTKSYDAQRLFDSSSDENSSSSSRGTSLDLIIPPPKNFLGQNNPFRVISPKKNAAADATAASTSSGKKSVSFGIFNTTALNFSSKLAALKSSGLFPKLSTSNLAKAAGQPRTVRTIKRRLSAKDITIGPNQEVRRRRTRRLSSNIEVISTQTINPIPTNYFPIHAKDLLAAAAASTTTAATLFTTTQTKTSPTTLSLNNNNNSLASLTPNKDAIAAPQISSTAPIETAKPLPTHGRRLRQRPQKNSPNTSRRSSVSSNQSSNSSTSAAAIAAAAAQTAAAASAQTTRSQQTHEDLKQTVNKYFGVVNRIESGEQFSIRAKRQLANGQMQYLIEWGDVQNGTPVKDQGGISLKEATATTQQLTNIKEVVVVDAGSSDKTCQLFATETGTT